MQRSTKLFAASRPSRRAFLTHGGVGLAAGLAGLGAGRLGRAHAALEARYHGGIAEWPRYRFVGQEIMDTQAIFWLGNAPSGLTDIGEVLGTLAQISPGDERSWFEAWLGTSSRLRGEGERSLAAGHALSAGSLLLRAGAYLRAGLMRYADRDDPRLVETTRDALALHGRALALLGYDSEEIAIPYEGGELYGRAYFTPRRERAPVLVLHQGLHAWPEDTKWVIDGAIARGFHVMSFHGPGQGASLRLHGHPFRPDWEAAVSPVLDLLERDERFDSNRIALMGLSFGGYFAPRAAAADARVRALIADPGVLDWSAAMMLRYEAIPGLLGLFEMGPEVFDRAVESTLHVMPDAVWYFHDVTWKHGVDSPSELIEDLRRYGDVGHAAAIRCPTLVLDGSAEDVSPGEAEKLAAAVAGSVTYMRFERETAAHTHCQGGGTLYAQARIFDWLEEELPG